MITALHLNAIILKSLSLNDTQLLVDNCLLDEPVEKILFYTL